MLLNIPIPRTEKCPLLFWGGTCEPRRHPGEQLRECSTARVGSYFGSHIQLLCINRWGVIWGNVHHLASRLWYLPVVLAGLNQLHESVIEKKAGEKAT
jgi:hypothetical protein